MNWLSIVFYLLTHFTDIIDLVRKFLDIIHGIPKDQQQAIMEKIQQARASGDHDAVRELIQKTCDGEIGCPSDVKAP